MLLTTVVVRLLPFHSTVDEGTKLDPLIVNVKASPPAGALLGEILVTLGEGLGVDVGVDVAADPDPQPAKTTQRDRANRTTAIPFRGAN